MRSTPTLELKLYDGTDAPDLVSGYNASMATLDESRILCFKRPLAGTDDLNDIKDTGYYNDAPNVIPANAAPGLTRPVRYIVLDTSMTTGMGECTTQIAVGTPVAGKDNMLVRGYHASTGWTEWLPVSAEQGALPANGAAGQVLVKSSTSDYDCEWADPSALNSMVAYNGRSPVGASSSVTISENHDAGEDFNNLVNAGVEAVAFNGGGVYPVFISYSLASGSFSVNNMPAIGAIAMPDDTTITITAILPAPKRLRRLSTEILAIPLIITVRKACKSIVQLSCNDVGYTNNGIRVTPFVYSIGEAS